jgi:hypothetical protein
MSMEDFFRELLQTAGRIFLHSWQLRLVGSYLTPSWSNLVSASPGAAAASILCPLPHTGTNPPRGILNKHESISVLHKKHILENNFTHALRYKKLKKRYYLPGRHVIFKNVRAGHWRIRNKHAPPVLGSKNQQLMIYRIFFYFDFYV